jgi:hypothetical protein
MTDVKTATSTTDAASALSTGVSLPHYRRWLLLILLTAVFLRLYAITDAPPGLTHDEADHGITAWQVVNGLRGVYFTIGYGREPLYDYATAGLMALIGPTYLAGRVTAVYFSLIMIAGMAAWVRRAFDAPTALLTAAGLAVGFWPVMAGRQMLRSITLPALFVLALLFWWRSINDLRLVLSEVEVLTIDDYSPIINRKYFDFAQYKSLIVNVLVAGLFLGATFYTYIPSRVLWAVFPVLLAYAAWRQRPFRQAQGPPLRRRTAAVRAQGRPFLRRAWWSVGGMLVVAALVGWPLFHYLAAHPDAEVRIDELRVPLTAVTEGNFQPLIKNTLASLRLFTIEGDSTWRYNVPGRPLLQPVMGVLFYLGLAVAAWQIVRGQNKQSRASFLALAWLLAGFSPVLVTGPGLSTTQAIGMQPVLYLFPALALVTAGRFLKRRGAGGQGGRGGTLSPFHLFTRSPVHTILTLFLYAATAVTTFRAYFNTWANAPEVRVQYETTMVAAMDYLNEYRGGETAVSTITPHAEHSPAIAQLTLHNTAVNLHWFDGRYSLLLPAAADSTIILPGFTPLPPLLAGYFGTAVLAESLPLRPTDRDRPLNIYQVNGAAMRTDWLNQFTTDAGPVGFGGAVTLLGYDVATTAVSPGALVQAATLWQVERPLDGAVLFTHLLGPDGTPIAQADRLDVPGESWQPGDWFIQLHEFVVPAGTAVGDYPLTVGVYTCPGGVPCPDGQRLPTATGATTLTLTNLSITQ